MSAQQPPSQRSGRRPDPQVCTKQATDGPPGKRPKPHRDTGARGAGEPRCPGWGQCPRSPATGTGLARAGRGPGAGGDRQQLHQGRGAGLRALRVCSATVRGNQPTGATTWDGERQSPAGWRPRPRQDGLGNRPQRHPRPCLPAQAPSRDPAGEKGAGPRGGGREEDARIRGAPRQTRGETSRVGTAYTSPGKKMSTGHCILIKHLSGFNFTDIKKKTAQAIWN